MKNTINTQTKGTLWVLALVALLLPSACNKDELLNPTPQNSLSELDAFDTPQRFLSNLNGLYSRLKDGQFYGGRFIVYGDIRGEEFLNETGNGVTGLQTWNHTVSEASNEVNNLWNAAYTTINACNIYIDQADKNRAVVGNDALVNQYIAEARFLRALSYHSLLQYYARPYADGNGTNLGVPLRLLPETGPGNNDLARATVDQVTTQILADLDAAEEGLAATNGSALLNVTRAHKNSARALKVRVYLWKQDYNQALVEAADLVPASAPYIATSGVPHALHPTVKGVFTTPYTTVESIFSMPFTSNNLPGTQNGLGSYYNPGPRGIGDYSLNPAGIIGDTVNFKKTDDRLVNFVLINNNKPYLNKFPTGPEHLDYAPVLRYAEVLLNVAEAEARLNGVNQRSVDLLNHVRGRSDASTQFTVGDFGTADDLINAILLERRMELLGEGFRAFDCMRLLQPIPGKANVAAVLPSVSEYIWQIPSGERAVNKLIVQNP